MKRVMLLLVVSMIAKADLTSFIICDDLSIQSSPAIDGGLVAWVDERSGNMDIYAKMLPGGETEEICTEYGIQSNPAVSGSVIVWQDGRKQFINPTADNDIYGYDFSLEILLTICTDDSEQQFPDVSGRIVVWQEGEGTNRDIYGINLDGGEKFLICGNDEYDQAYPAISGHYVVWQDNRNGGYDIYCRDLNDLVGSEFPVCEAAGDQVSPDIDGQLIAWRDFRSDASGDIYGYDLSAIEPVENGFPICAFEERQSQPTVSGDWIIWQDRRYNSTSGYDIIGYNYSAKTETMICTAAGSQDTPAVSGQYVVWRDAVGFGDIHGAAFPVEASITVISPNGGETFIAGSQQQIQWQSLGTVSTVKIELYNGSGWQVLADNVPNTGSLNLTVPADINSQQCLVRISDTASPAVTDQSNTEFTIFQCTLTADLTGDCYVDLADYVEFASQWLQCGNRFDPQWCQNQ